mmetsp:Transcript_13228/g.22661  ORF Transcript_13228/g.22661 Transcript_13228/m.22661 type:complete len:318 (-) Transcript_13228:120-1073(-)
MMNKWCTRLSPIIGFLIGFLVCSFRRDGYEFPKFLFLHNGYPGTFEMAYSTDENKLYSSPTMYGLLHMAKVAGTTINGELAAHFERVCGNKGYSYDAYQFNMRQKEASKRTNCTGMKCSHDSFTKLGLTNRGQLSKSVGKELRDEIGFEDCDYVSMEDGYQFWTKKFLPVGGAEIKKELHVPCRQDPLDHLMSMANFARKTFDCSATDLRKEVNQVVIFEGRFDKLLLELEPNMTVHCFAAIPVQPYLDYMSYKLQRKRIEIDYVHRDTNRHRNKDDECIWKDDKVRSEVKKILTEEHDYFSFCNNCLGSNNDLLKG